MTLSVAALVPHTGVALLLCEVLDVGEDGVTCRAAFPETSPFVIAGQVQAVALLEVMAQAAAAFSGLRSAQNQHGTQTPTITPAPTTQSRAPGYVAGVRAAEFHVATVNAGTCLHVTARLTGQSGDSASYACSVSADGDLLARADLTVVQATAAR